MQVKSINKNKFLIFSTIGILAIGVFLLIDILIGMSDIGFKDIIVLFLIIVEVKRI